MFWSVFWFWILTHYTCEKFPKEEFLISPPPPLPLYLVFFFLYQQHISSVQITCGRVTVDMKSRVNVISLNISTSRWMRTTKRRGWCESLPSVEILPSIQLKVSFWELTSLSSFPSILNIGLSRIYFIRQRLPRNTRH